MLLKMLYYEALGSTTVAKSVWWMRLIESHSCLDLLSIPWHCDLDQMPDNFCRKLFQYLIHKWRCLFVFFLFVCFLYDRKIRCILESGIEMCSTGAEYGFSSNKMMAIPVYLSFQHVSRISQLNPLPVTKTEILHFISFINSFYYRNFRIFIKSFYLCELHQVYMSSE